MICLTLSGSTLDEMRRETEENGNYVDLVELRLDLLDEKEQGRASLFPSMVDKPVILTCRRVKDGGKWDKSERLRRALMLSALDGEFRYIDIEEDIRRNTPLEVKARERGVRIIRSLHIFGESPSNLLAIAKKMATGGDIVKIAIMVRSIRETEELFRLSQKLSDIDKIIIGMGEYGLPTRVLYRKMGSYLVFSSEKEVAPGQISAKKLKMLYRADRVNKTTRVFGIVGNPVLHSLSPEIHNPAFHSLNIDAIYLPFPSESIGAFFHFAEYMRIEGFSVTIPYKKDVLSYLGNVDREVKMIGSCNTVVRRGELWKGLNTDYSGFILPIIKDIESSRIKSALVVGAGGASNAVVWALRNFSIKVTILNRTLEKAEILAKNNLSDYDTLENRKKYEGKVDLIVQTTSVGLYPGENISPLEGFSFTGKEIAYDIIYRPKMTKFLKDAAEKGCTLHFGSEMLMAQARLQFKAFTQQDYPKELNVLED